MYKKTEQGWLKHLDFILLDVLSAQIALVLAYGLRHGFDKWMYDKVLYRNLAIWMAFFGVAVAVLFNTMHDVLKRRWTVEIRMTVTQSLLVFSTVIIYLFSVKDAEQYSRITLWVMLLLYIPLAFTIRMLWKQVLRQKIAREKRRVMLLISDQSSAEDAIERIKNHPMEGIRLCGLVLIDRDAAGESFGDLPIVSNMQDVARYICREWIDEVYIAVENFDGFPRDLLEKCRQMGVTMHLQMMPLGMGKQTVEKIAGMPVITNSINIASPLQLMLKRLLDIFGGIALSIVAVLAIIIVGPIIKIKSPGPILYKQERIGQNGRRFKMFKIRSMYMDADARKQELMKQNRVASGMMFKLDFDPRIIGNEQLADGTRKTGIGEFIRRTSIDELPQGFNVLLNQMSLVGTRPPTVDEWEKYELHHRARLATKPGITGMWQVSGRSNITDFEEITRLDTEYIENWSIGLDIRILVKTVGTVLAHRGAM